MQVYGGGRFPVYGWNFILGQAIQTTQGGGNLRLELFGAQATADAEPNYRLLDTDYENYTIVYSCDSYIDGWLHADNLWIMAREPTMSDSLFAKITDILAEKILYYDVMQDTHKTYQGDWCEYDEVPEISDP